MGGKSGTEIRKRVGEMSGCQSWREVQNLRHGRSSQKGGKSGFEMCKRVGEAEGSQSWKQE
jgi:hypothetical protein